MAATRFSRSVSYLDDWRNVCAFMIWCITTLSAHLCVSAHLPCHYYQNNPSVAAHRRRAQWSYRQETDSVLFESVSRHDHICSFTFCEWDSVSYSGPQKPFCDIKHEYQPRYHRLCVPAAGWPLWLYNVFVLMNSALWDQTDMKFSHFLHISWNKVFHQSNIYFCWHRGPSECDCSSEMLNCFW